ncbi:hypothetical protein ACA910_007323 [Epithemia clementina (nom. ined.)]
MVTTTRAVAAAPHTSLLMTAGRLFPNPIRQRAYFSNHLLQDTTTTVMKQNEEDATITIYPITAVHLGQSIDMAAVVHQVFPFVAAATTTNSTNTSTTGAPATATATTTATTTTTTTTTTTNASTHKKPLVVVELPRDGGSAVDNSHSTTTTTTTTLAFSSRRYPADPSAPRYIAVYGFGSVVGWNLAPHELQFYLDQITPHVTDRGVQPEPREDFGVQLLHTNNNNNNHKGVESSSPPIEGGGGGKGGQELTTPTTTTTTTTTPQQPPQRQAAVVTGDYCVLPASSFNVHGVTVICNILAQTVALDAYNARVDDILHQFANLNARVVRNSNHSTSVVTSFSAADRLFLFQSIAQSNAIVLDLLRKIRLKDRSDTAWKFTNFEALHYGLVSEFELEARFDQMDYKLNLIQQNSKFFWQVLASHESHLLTVTIVVLIVVECLLSLVEMTGLGDYWTHQVVEYATWLASSWSSSGNQSPPSPPPR